MNFGGDDEEIDRVIGGEVKIDIFKIDILNDRKYYFSLITLF